MKSGDLLLPKEGRRREQKPSRAHAQTRGPYGTARPGALRWVWAGGSPTGGAGAHALSLPLAVSSIQLECPAREGRLLLANSTTNQSYNARLQATSADDLFSK